MGTEFDLWSIPDIILAYLARLSKRAFDDCRGLINFSTRLFPRVLRFYGWGHLFGNLMKFACFSIEGWPSVLEKIRALVRFFRNATWRNHVVRLLGERLPNVWRLLKNSNANLAKWRYETMYVCMRALLKLRELCERLLVDIRHMFNDFQDGALLTMVAEACSLPWLWQFMECFCNFVLTPLEYVRRWGLFAIVQNTSSFGVSIHDDLVRAGGTADERRR